MKTTKTTEAPKNPAFDGFSWAVGYFEGEGYIDTKRPRLVVGSTDRDALEQFVEIVGVGKVMGPYHDGNPKHKPHYRWTISRWEEVAPLLRRMLPHLHSRRREAAEHLLANPRSHVTTSGPREQRTHCAKGHRLTEDNIYRAKNGPRCLECKRTQARESARRRYAATRATAPN